MGEKITKEEARELELERDRKALTKALSDLLAKPGPDNSPLVKKMDEILVFLKSLQVTIEAPKVTVDVSSISATMEKYMAQLQHEVTKAQSQVQPQAPSAMKIEFTRNGNGYIQSPITVTPV